MELLEAFANRPGMECVKVADGYVELGPQLTLTPSPLPFPLHPDVFSWTNGLKGGTLHRPLLVSLSNHEKRATRVFFRVTKISQVTGGVVCVSFLYFFFWFSNGTPAGEPSFSLPFWGF